VRAETRHLITGGLIILLLAALVYFGLDGDPAYVYEADSALLAAIGAIGLNVLVGYAGQISVGTPAFLGIGAYGVVITQGHVPFPIPLLVGAAAAALVGLVVGLPSLRLRGMYLVFSTLALQYIAAYLFNEYDTDTNALAGHTIKPAVIFGAALTQDRAWFVVLCLIVLILGLFVWNISRGRPGRAWAAMRTSENAASVMGVNVVWSKLSAFMLSSFIIGLAGGLGAYFLTNVSATSYTIDLAISYIAMVLIGGMRSVPGAVIGAAIVTMLPFLIQNNTAFISGTALSNFFSQNLSSINTAIYGLGVLVFLYARPGGIASFLHLPRRAGEAVAQTLETSQESARHV
jgi:branched-chain amino acid transport system permease protein